MECVIIGIAGGSGSGKSTFTNKLKALYGDRITVLYHDNYYRSLQFVEFFGKFYEGGGKPFEPFKENTKYVEIKED